MEKICSRCKEKFLSHPAVKNQQYCGNSECQKARKRKWQKEKLKSDPDYRENQAASQREWRRRNRDYWKKYRKRNPAYRERNRLRQRERRIAKMDEQMSETIISSGRYRLVPLVANMDELIVEIGVVSRRCATG